MTGGRHAGRAIQGVRRKELPGYLYLLVLAARHVSRGGLAVHVRRPGRGAPAVSECECECVCVCVCAVVSVPCLAVSHPPYCTVLCAMTCHISPALLCVYRSIDQTLPR